MTAAQKVQGTGRQPGPFANNLTNVVEFPTSLVPGKALALLKAKMEIAGHHVYEDDNEGFVVVQANWGMSRHCPDRASLQRFARIVGVWT